MSANKKNKAGVEIVKFGYRVRLWRIAQGFVGQYEFWLKVHPDILQSHPPVWENPDKKTDVPIKYRYGVAKLLGVPLKTLQELPINKIPPPDKIREVFKNDELSKLPVDFRVVNVYKMPNFVNSHINKPSDLEVIMSTTLEFNHPAISKVGKLKDYFGLIMASEAMTDDIKTGALMIVYQGDLDLNHLVSGNIICGLYHNKLLIRKVFIPETPENETLILDSSHPDTQKYPRIIIRPEDDYMYWGRVILSTNCH